jgi:hypothetical protein
MFMKKFILLFFISLVFFISYSQSLTDVARSKELTWYGVDFTQARISGYNKTESAKCSFKDWSFTTLSALDSVMIKGAYGKKILNVETSITAQRNQAVNCDSVYLDKTYTVTIDKMNQVISEYNLKGSGYGVLLLVETIEQAHDNLFVWVIYVDNHSGRIINSRRYLSGGYGKPGNNFSISGIKYIIKLSGKDLKHYK